MVLVLVSVLTSFFFQGSRPSLFIFFVPGVLVYVYLFLYFFPIDVFFFNSPFVALFVVSGFFIRPDLGLGGEG